MLLLVYVIVWLAVVFGIGINSASASNAGWKTVVVLDFASPALLATVFPSALLALLIPNTAANRTSYYKLIQYILKSHFKSVSVAVANVLIEEVWSVVFSEHVL